MSAGGDTRPDTADGFRRVGAADQHGGPAAKDRHEFGVEGGAIGKDEKFGLDAKWVRPEWIAAFQPLGALSAARELLTRILRLSVN